MLQVRHGVLRAADGLLISTEARPKAEAHAKDMAETTRRLEQAHEQHAMLGDLARQHQAQDGVDQPGVAKELLAQNQSIAGVAGSDKAEKEPGSFVELNAPHIALASPVLIDSTTPGTTHQHSGQHHAISSAWHTSIAAAKSLLVSAREAIRLFAYKDGFRLVSAKEDMNIQALQTSVHLLAKLDITMTASRIMLTAAEKVSINGGGSYTQWSAAGIRSHTTGEHAVHATRFDHVDHKTVAAVMPSLPFVPENTPKNHSVRLNIAALMGVDVLSKALDAQLPFRAYSASGELVATGRVDSEGYTPFIYTHQPEKLRVVIGDGGWHKHKDIIHV